MDRYELEFHDIEHSLHAREGSTTLIATVASSASVILIGGFPLLTPPLTYAIWILGFTLPILGEVYREVTTLTIDAADYIQLSALWNMKKARFLRNHPYFTRHRSIRRSAIRFLLLSPCLAWILMGLNSGVERQTLGALYLLVVGVAGILVLARVVNWLNSLELNAKSQMKEGIREDFLKFLESGEREGGS